MEMRVMPGPPEDQEDYENLIFFRSWANDGSSLRQVITKKAKKPRPLQIAYNTALSESLILSTIHMAYTSAPFTQSTIHTIHIDYRCITIIIAYRPKISHFQDRDR